MQTAFDIVAIGECLIEFVPSFNQEQGKLNFSVTDRKWIYNRDN
jgi:hypothetical protein